LLVVDVVLIVNIPGELNPCFSTFNPAQSAGHRNVLAGDQNFEPLGQVPHWNRRKLRARQTHVLQIAEYVIPLIANQQADWLVGSTTRTNLKSGRKPPHNITRFADFEPSRTGSRYYRQAPDPCGTVTAMIDIAKQPLWHRRPPPHEPDFFAGPVQPQVTRTGHGASP